MKVDQKSITAAGQWTAKFTLRGDDPVLGPGRASVLMEGGSGNVVTVRKYDTDGATVIGRVRIDQSSELAVVGEGLYDAGIDTGDFGTGPVLVTVVQ